MKSFTHASAGVVKLEDLTGILQASVMISRNEWKDVAELEITVEPGLPSVPCLRDEIGQVVLNLVVNAAHAVAAKVAAGALASGQISLSAQLRDGMVELRVADNGTGIPEALRDRVFEPFFTTKEVGKGSGQGLAIAYSIVVEHHHGQISLESELGRGTCFIVRLPLAPGPAGAAIQGPQNRG